MKGLAWDTSALNGNGINEWYTGHWNNGILSVQDIDKYVMNIIVMKLSFCQSVSMKLWLTLIPEPDND